MSKFKKKMKLACSIKLEKRRLMMRTSKEGYLYLKGSDQVCIRWPTGLIKKLKSHKALHSQRIKRNED